jgi:hypothetical protein
VCHHPRAGYVELVCGQEEGLDSGGGEHQGESRCPWPRHPKRPGRETQPGQGGGLPFYLPGDLGVGEQWEPRLGVPGPYPVHGVAPHLGGLLAGVAQGEGHRNLGRDGAGVMGDPTEQDHMHGPTLLLPLRSGPYQQNGDHDPCGAWAEQQDQHPHADDGDVAQ